MDTALVEQLAKNPTGGVKAVVTAWGRDGLDDIQNLGVTGTKLKVLPMILTPALTKAQLDELASSPAVRSVWANTKYDLLMEDSTWITRARYVWGSSTPAGAEQPPDELRPLGVTGAGVELAVIDTGFDGMHEDGDNLIEFCETLQAVTFTRDSVACTPWDPDFNPAPAGPCGALSADLPNPFPDPLDPPTCENLGVHPARGDSRDEDVSHGTHVGGTMAGTGHASGGTRYAHSTIGMAPHAQLRVYSANVASALAAHEILSSYDDLTYKKEQGYNNVVAVNNSWGGGGGSNYNPNDPQHMAFKRAWQAGILSVFAAGNSGHEHNMLGAQCVSPYVACVAATTKADQVVMFSSRGRPSQVADTNRNGTAGDAGDIPPDNHDWRLGQALERGRYRPTLAAPGVGINSMKAIGLNIGDPTSIECRETPDEIDMKAGCYVQAQGTSMATPHVTGAIGLIVQAYRQGHDGRTPSPNDLIDILERSSNKTKLPAWEAEEQGAGRLDAYEAVKLARSYSRNGPRPNLGYATPPYVDGAYPSGPNSLLAGEDDKGCTGTGSWSSRTVDLSLTEPPADAPPLPSGIYGQHFINVPEKVDRLRVTITWPRHPSANLYGRLWRPGVVPDTDTQTPDYAGRTSPYFQTRAWPDQEATGLPIGLPPTSRVVDVRSPEESNVGVRGEVPTGRSSPAEGGAPPALPSGQWVLRVYHRAGGGPLACDGDSDENPKQLTGFNYNLKVEVGRVTHRPTVRIDSPPRTEEQDDRFVEIRGRAGYPPPPEPAIGNRGHSWEGVTNWEVPDTAGTGEGGGPAPDYTLESLYFHGNNHVADDPDEPGQQGEPGEEGCTSQGNLDVAIVGCGPFLLPGPLSPLSPAARFGPSSPLVNGVADRNIYDPNWTWCLAVGPGCPPAPLAPDMRRGPVTLQGPMTVEWWASTFPAADTPGLFTMGWTFRVWADGQLRYQSPRIEATPDLANVPDRLTATVTLPRIHAEQRIVLHVDTNELDIDQEATFVYYDSEKPCLGPLPPGPACDSLVRMPVIAEGTGTDPAEPTGIPRNVRVTDLPVGSPGGEYPAPSVTPPALRVAWDAIAGASYRVHRSTDSAFMPSSGNRVYSGPGQACPQGESPNTPNDNNPAGEERAGVCFTDMGVSLLRTYYYRVVAVKDGRPSETSGVAYGTPTEYDRQVKLKVDRLYGPQVWEYALLPSSPTPPDTTNRGLEWRFLWDTLELLGTEYEATEAVFGFDSMGRPTVQLPGTVLSDIPHLIFARSFTQGIGSTKDGRLADLDDDGEEEPPPPDGGCPDDDDGDGDDDEEDGDDDDNGDDDDDDCEDDDDDEEDEDD